MTVERITPDNSLCFAQHISRYEFALQFAKKKTVLDIACGTGYGSNLIAKTAKNLFAIDISKEALEFAKHNYSRRNISFLEGDVLDIPLDDNSMDLVISFETLEHIEEQDKFISEVRRVLKPNGIFLVSTPDKSGYQKVNNPFHKKELNKKEFNHALKKYFKSVSVFNQNTRAFIEFGNENNITSPKEDCSPFFIAACANKKVTFKKHVKLFNGLDNEILEKYMAINYLKAKLNEKDETLKAKLKEKDDILWEKQYVLNGILDSRSWKLLSMCQKIKKSLVPDLINKKMGQLIDAMLVNRKKDIKSKLDVKHIFSPTKEPYSPGSDERCIEIPWALSCYKNERRVLEVGCSFATENYIRELKKLNIPELHGIDISEKMAPDFIMRRADIRATGYPQEYFNIIFCISTIEHIGKDNTRYLGTNEKNYERADISAIKEMSRILAKGGKLIITVPFGKYKDHGWFIHYDQKYLNSLIDSSGLAVIKKDFFIYKNDGWYKSKEEDLQNVSYNDNNSPAAAGLACILLYKK